MSEIAELERRLTTALDRIGAGLGRIGKAAATPYAEQLAAAREANDALEERLRGIEEREQALLAALEDEVASLKAALAATDADLQRLRAVNSDLRASNAALREANAQGLADAGLVNDAMTAEIEALRALDAANRAEIDRALSLLEPLLEGEAAHA